MSIPAAQAAYNTLVRAALAAETPQERRERLLIALNDGALTDAQFNLLCDLYELREAA
ncbi:hypothetical protein ACSMXM_05565 [Pacificimonas sp. ICDLI1SI03]